MADGVQKWADFKALMDDPHLPDETKKNLVLSLAASNYYYYDSPGTTLDGYDSDAFQAYEDKYGVKDDQVSQYLKSGAPSFDDVSSKAQDAAKSGAEHDKAVTDGKNKLADMEKAAGSGEFGGAGAKNSNEILDQGAPALKYMSDFLPLYAKAGSQFKDSTDPVQQMKQIYERYDEQRDIPFDKFLDEATKLDKAADSARDASGDMGSELSTLFEHWTGDAADGAQQLYSTQDKTTQDVVVKSVRDAGALVKQSQASVAQIVRGKATSTLDIFHASDPNFSNGMLAGKSTDQWSTTIDVANGSEDSGTLRLAAEAWGVHIDENCSGSLTSSSMEAIRQKAMEVVHNILVKNVTQDWTDFMKMCDETKKSVDTTWKSLTDFGGKLKKDPYQPQPDSTGPGQDGKDNPGKNGPQGFTAPSGGQDQPGGQQGNQPPPPGSVSATPEIPQQPDGGPGATPPTPKTPDLSGINAGGGPTDPSGATPPAGGSTPPTPKMPDLSGIDANSPDPTSGGPTTPSGSTPKMPDLSGIGGGGSPSGGGGGPSGGGPSGGGPTLPTPKMPDLSGVGSDTPQPFGGGSTDPASSAPPTPKMPDLSGVAGDTGPGSSTPTPKMPDLSGVGSNVPMPTGPGSTDPLGKSTVDKLKLPNGETATISKPDAQGHQRLTIKDKDGKKHEFDLDYDGKPGPHKPGVTNVLPNADGQLVIHDGKTQLTIDKPGPDGATPITVDSGGKSEDFRLVPPGTKLDTPDLDLSGLGDTPTASAATPDLSGIGGGGAGGGGVGGMGGGDSASFAGAGVGAGAHAGTTAQPGGFSDAAVARTDQHGVPAGAAGLPADQGTKPSGSGMGGGMGGMGGGHGGGQGGGDKERQSKWGMAGNLFDETEDDRRDRLHNFLDGKPREKKS